jgi:iron complex transport system ATP-binding protein
LLVLDEPESNLDFRNQLLILTTINELVKSRLLSAVINTHYPAHALQLGGKALMLNRDGSSYYGPSSDVITEERMHRSFDVTVKINPYWYEGVTYRSVIPVSVG